MREARAQHATTRWTIRRARTLALFAGFVGIVTTAACGSDGPSVVSPTGSSTPKGDYSMSTVNGQALPFATAQDASYKLEVTAGTVSLGSDGRFVSAMTTRQTIPGNVSTFVDSFAGVWSQAGSKITLTYSDPIPADTATWSGNTLTLVAIANKVSLTTIYTKK